MPETDQPDPDDDDDDSSVETIVSHDDGIEDIEEIMQYLDLCERGLVADTSPTQPPVPTHVGNNRRTVGEGFFLNLDDAADGIAGLADPDEFNTFGAENENV